MARHHAAHRHAADRVSRRRVPRGADCGTARRRHDRRPTAVRRRGGARPVAGHRRRVAAACVRARAFAPPGDGGNGRGPRAAADRCHEPVKSAATALPPPECDRRKRSADARIRTSPRPRHGIARRRRHAHLSVAAPAEGSGAVPTAAAGRYRPGAAAYRCPRPVVPDSSRRYAEVPNPPTSGRGDPAAAPQPSTAPRWVAARTGGAAATPPERNEACPVTGVAAPPRAYAAAHGQRSGCPPRGRRTHAPVSVVSLRALRPWRARTACV